MTKAPSYLMLRNGIYYFQTRIPADFVHDKSIKHKLIRRSTRTGNRREALRIARTWWVEIMTGKKTDTDTETWEREARREDWLYHRGKILMKEVNSIDPHDNYLRDWWFEDKTHEDRVAMNFYQEWLEKNGEACEASAAIDHSDSTPAKRTGATGSPRVSELIQRYMKVDYLKEKQRAAKTKDQFERQLNLFAEMVGNPMAHELTKAMVRDLYGDRIDKIPVNMNKKGIYKDGTVRKPIDEVIEIAERTEDKTFAAKTIVNYVIVVRGFLSWLDEKEYTQGDVGTVLKDLCGLANSDEEKEKKFTPAELKLLFETEDYRLGLLMKKPERHWSPLIALFSGAREGEICQLHLSDISYDESCKVHVIDFNNKEGKRLKNKHSARAVPIHKTLMDLGFLNYVEMQRRRGEVMLFSNSKPDKYGNYGKNVSRWFNGENTNGGKRRSGYKEKCGVFSTETETKNFHSFRHTFINYGKQNDLDGKVMREMTGHASGEKDVHGTVYEDSYEMKTRKKVINKMKFEIDFDSIKKWP